MEREILISAKTKIALGEPLNDAERATLDTILFRELMALPVTQPLYVVAA